MRGSLLPVLLAVLLVLSGTGTAVAAVSGSSDAGVATFQSDERFQTGGVDADRVVLRADVKEDGSATWTVEYRLQLDSEERRAAFDDLQSDIEENRSVYRDHFAGRMDDTVSTAADATGREMGVSNVSVSTNRQTLPNDYGVVTYQFEWIGFAAVDDGTLHMGDALSGMFIDEQSRLVVSWPESYEATNVRPTPDEQKTTTAVWHGPTDFGSDEPRITATNDGGLSTALLAGGAVVLIGVAVAGVWFVRRRETAPPDGTDESAGGDAADEFPTEPNLGSDAPRATPELDSHTGSESESHAGPEPEPEAESTSVSAPFDDDVPVELLSNEERVLRLLHRNGGRVKQQDVVSELGWTEARTSQVVSGLRDEGKLESFRLGRENVLRLPEEEE